MHNQTGDALRGWEFGVGREWGGGGQFTSNLGQGWTGSHHEKEGFQVSKRDLRKGRNWQGKMAKGNQQGE